ncbi:MAG: DUF4097 family beta strand repeat protein [Nocardia sp.]|nr:DUF4097 family beta strand repeat protein [Nocardia sp.]
MQTFQTSAPIAVTVEVLSADVTVIASDRTDTVVEVKPADATKKADVRAAEQTTVDFTAGTLTVTTPKTWRTHTPFGGNPSIEVTIQVPTGSQLKGTVAVGQLLGAGELGRCELSNSLGDIIVERPQDSVTASTAKGNIRIGEAARGELRLQTSLGELEVGISPRSAVRLETNTSLGSVENRLDPVVSVYDKTETVQVYARNTLGNITVRHTTAA